MAVYEDGHGHCFSCSNHLQEGSFSTSEVAGNRNEDPENLLETETSSLLDLAHKRKPTKGPSALIQNVASGPLEKRKIREATARYFGYGTAFFRGQRVHVAPYADGTGRLVAQKIRTANKDFTILGDIKAAGLFGQHLCQGGGKMLIITEGEIDTLAVWQTMGGRWPVVSLKNGAGVGPGAKKVARDLAGQMDFLLKFEKVVLCFDMDAAGRDSAEAAAHILPPGKAHVVVLPGAFKDAGEMVEAGLEKSLQSAIFGAQVWRPDGIVSLCDPVIMAKACRLPTMGYKYPWPGLNDRLFGLHPGQIHVLGAGSGTGKSVACAELVVHFRRQGFRIAYLALEESVAMTAQRLAGIVLNKPLYLPGKAEGITELQITDALKEIGENDGLFLYDHFGSLDTDILFTKLRYLQAHLGVQIVVLDHISIIISGNDDNNNERRMIDVLMTRLRSLCEETGLAMIVVTHLARKQGTPFEEGASVTLASFRGSGAIGQLADAAIGLERDQQAAEENKRDITVVRVVKARLGGRTGEACSLRYNHETGRLLDLVQEFDENGTCRSTTTKHDDY